MLSEEKITRESLCIACGTPQIPSFSFGNKHTSLCITIQFQTYDSNKLNQSTTKKSLKTKQCQSYSLFIVFCLENCSSPLCPYTCMSSPGSFEIMVIPILAVKCSNLWSYLPLFQTHEIHSICAHFFNCISTWNLQKLLLYHQITLLNHWYPSKISHWYSSLSLISQ